MSSNNNNNNHRKRGVDAVLVNQAKSLPVGATCSFRLIKGPGLIASPDPVDASAPSQLFPLTAKFSEPLKQQYLDGARLYQQDVPKPVADSDEEEAEAQAAAKKKRWKYNKAVNRQWILQQEVDFLATMVARREKKKLADNNTNRYEGVPEHNSSHYALLLADNTGQLQVRTLPTPHGTIAFQQARQGLSISQAEQAIQDERVGIRTVASHPNTTAPTLRLPTKKKANNSKNRLMNKLQSSDADLDEGDDVMGDVAYRHRKGAGAAARKELLSSLGDGLNVSEEGVLGGTNDTAFGGRDRFAQLSNNAAGESQAKAQKQSVEHTERGADGAAMEEDFYQRDVKAEYEELDYDANEQFDDDDVDLGESEVVVDSGGFGDEDEADEELEEDMEEEQVTGAEGLATAAGFRLMLAKARGEVPVQPAATEVSESASPGSGADKMDQDTKPAATPTQDDGGDHMAKIMAAADKAAQVLKGKPSGEKEEVAGKIAPTAASGIQVDENGLRIISMDAVRREIWLNHNSIAMKRLMKIFQVSKKSTQDRQSKFRDVVKELCTMKSDHVGARMLVLKQHYSNMP